jgi:hypothetical protein
MPLLAGQVLGVLALAVALTQLRGSEPLTQPLVAGLAAVAVVIFGAVEWLRWQDRRAIEAARRRRLPPLP